MDPQNTTAPATHAAAPVASAPEHAAPQTSAQAEAKVEEHQAPAKESHEEIIAKKDEEIKALKARISALENKPAEQHAAVVDAPKAMEKGSDYFADMKAAAELYNSLP